MKKLTQQKKTKMFRNNIVFIALLGILLAGCEIPQSSATKIELPEPESAGAKLMKKYCSDCHAPPATTVHIAEEWPNVIYRMQERRRMKAYELLNDEERATLVNYLQKHAKSSGAKS